MSIATIQTQSVGEVSERTFPRVFFFQVTWIVLLGSIFYFFAM